MIRRAQEIIHKYNAVSYELLDENSTNKHNDLEACYRYVSQVTDQTNALSLPLPLSLPLRLPVPAYPPTRLPAYPPTPNTSAGRT